MPKILPPWAQILNMLALGIGIYQDFQLEELEQQIRRSHPASPEGGPGDLPGEERCGAPRPGTADWEDELDHLENEMALYDGDCECQP